MFEYLRTKVMEFIAGNSIHKHFESMDCHLSNISKKCEKVHNKLDEDIKALTNEVELYRGMVHAIAEAIPDMLWFKDTNGVYIYANQAIKDGLLLDQHPEGKTDIMLAKAAKAKYGDKNHQFGEKCANSDEIVLNTLEKQKFFESGKVKGKMLYLEVYKAPFYINGNLLGVIGTGRDMTDYVTEYNRLGCTSCGNIFKLHEFQPEIEDIEGA